MTLRKHGTDFMDICIQELIMAPYTEYGPIFTLFEV